MYFSLLESIFFCGGRAAS